MNIRKLMMSVLAIALIVVSLQAQRRAGAVGIGAQFGSPTGLTLKVYNPSKLSLDILAAWDLDDFFFVNVHGLIEKPLGSDPKFNYFYGPGIFAGFRDRYPDNRRFDEGDFSAGISGALGLNALLGQLELYLQITPRLQLIDETDGEMGGGFGIRFYFP